MLLVEETGDCELANAEFLQAVHCKFVSAIILRNGDKLGACAFVFEATPPAILVLTLAIGINHLKLVSDGFAVVVSDVEVADIANPQSM